MIQQNKITVLGLILSICTIGGYIWINKGIEVALHSFLTTDRVIARSWAHIAVMDYIIPISLLPALYIVHAFLSLLSRKSLSANSIRFSYICIAYCIVALAILVFSMTSEFAIHDIVG